jgi:hypothetical protein
MHLAEVYARAARLAYRTGAGRARVAGLGLASANK